MRSIALVAAAFALTVPGVADAKVTYKTIKSSGTIQGNLVMPGSEFNLAFAGIVDDATLGAGATTSHGRLDGWAQIGWSTPAGQARTGGREGTARPPAHRPSRATRRSSTRRR
jgi:hypothetical protein